MLVKRVRAALDAPLIALALTSCVSVGKYNALQQQYDQLKAQMSSEVASDQVKTVALNDTPDGRKKIVGSK